MRPLSRYVLKTDACGASTTCSGVWSPSGEINFSYCPIWTIPSAPLCHSCESCQWGAEACTSLSASPPQEVTEVQEVATWTSFYPNWTTQVSSASPRRPCLLASYACQPFYRLCCPLLDKSSYLMSFTYLHIVEPRPACNVQGEARPTLNVMGASPLLTGWWCCV